MKGNHGGFQLSARVVLPADIDPETKQPSFVTVPGGTYDLVDRWQQLEITDVIASVERQARVLRAGSDGKRAVSLKGAFVESLILNLYGGPGPTEVFVDDLTISPVPIGAEANQTPAWRKPKGKNKGVQLNGDRLTLDGNDWVPAIIRAPGVDPAILKEHGFDVYSVDLDADPNRVKEAVKLGMHLMPHLNTPPGSAPKGTEALLTTIDTYPFRDDVAFWYVGDALGADPGPRSPQDRAGRDPGAHDRASQSPERLPRPHDRDRLRLVPAIRGPGAEPGPHRRPSRPVRGRFWSHWRCSATWSRGGTSSA